VGVVEVEGMDERAIGEAGLRGRQFSAASYHRGLGRSGSSLGDSLGVCCGLMPVASDGGACSV
jgi:hypothetical protein